MISTVALFFTKEFQSEYEPVHLLLGITIGVIGIVVIGKKILNNRSQK